MKIFSRAELGSRPFKTAPTRVALSERKYFVVHYPGAGTPPRDLVSLRRWIEKIHMDQNGWRGVGYNFVIDADGNVGEGCGRDVVGAHSPPRNRDGIGVMLWTSGGKTTPAAMRACSELLAHLEGQKGGKLTKSFHGEHYATECPGPQLRKWVQDGMPSPDGVAEPSKPKPTPAPKPKPAGWDGKTFPGAGAFKIGQSHPAVTVLGQRLVAHGFGGRYKVGPGPRFSEVDRLATQDFQLAQGYKGTQKGGGADGYPGPQTWAALMKAPKKAAPKPAKPSVSLSAVIKAAKLDGPRPQGGTTPDAAGSVRLVEKALQAEGLLSAAYAKDGSFGTATVKAYAAWQRKCGYSGAGADGIPGRESLVKLGSKHGFVVKT